MFISMDFKSYFEKSSKRNERMLSIFSKDKLKVNFDKLSSEKLVDHEVLYYNLNENDEEFTFVFGYDFFVKGLEEQEFKKMINQGSMNFKIYKAYRAAKLENKKVKIGDILNKMQNKDKDSLELHEILKKLLTLSYYMGWDVKKDKNDIESDFFIEIPETWLFRVKQRFNFDIMSAIYEDNNLFIFLNGKGKLVSVFKDLNEFTKVDIENKLFNALRKVFDISEFAE